MFMSSVKSYIYFYIFFHNYVNDHSGREFIYCVKSYKKADKPFINIYIYKEFAIKK